MSTAIAGVVFLLLTAFVVMMFTGGLWPDAYEATRSKIYWRSIKLTAAGFGVIVAFGLLRNGGIV